MTETPRPTPSLARLRDQAITSLTPFFATTPAADVTAARNVAEVMLDEYNAATPKELQLSAQIIALSWAALACLSAAMIVKDESLDEMLSFQEAAVTLDRSSRKASKALDLRRKERAKTPDAMTPENARWDEGAFQLALNQALERFNEANAKVVAFTAKFAPVEAKPKLPIVFAEQMTPAVLAKRRRQR